MVKRGMRRFAPLIAAIAGITIAASGCSTQTSDKSTSGKEAAYKKEAAAEKVLRIDESDLGYPSVYTVSPRGRGFLLTTFIFDTLTWKDEKGVVPMLAKSWECSADSKTWTFKLNDKAAFTDGKPVTAEDVAFSYNYLKKHPHPWVSLGMVKGVEVVNEHEVKIALNNVYNPFITDIAGNVPILPKHIWEKVKDPFKFNTAEAVIGSGPFKLEKYDVSAGSYTFRANPNYFLGKPVIDKLVYSQSKNPGSALKSGQLDAAQQLKYGEAKKIKKAGTFKVIEGPGYWVYRLYFNFKQPVFNNIKVRQALYYAINRDELVSKATRGGAIAGNPGFIHPDSQWYSSDVKQYEYDVKTANEMLDAAGAVDGNNDGIREYEGAPLKYTLLATNDRSSEAQMVKSYLAKVNVAVDIKMLDQKAVDGLIKKGDFDIALNGHGSMGGDPVLLGRFASNASAYGANPAITGQGGGKWANEQFDALFEQQVQELDKAKRKEQVAELQKILADELPTLPLYYRKIVFAYDPAKLNGWFFTSEGVALAVPTAQNKLVFIRGTWGK